MPGQGPLYVHVDHDGKPCLAATLAQAELLLVSGQLLGGSRPKATVVDDDGRLWVAKFPSGGDGRDMQPWEALVLGLAADCGIEVPRFMLATVTANASFSSSVSTATRAASGWAWSAPTGCSPRRTTRRAAISSWPGSYVDSLRGRGKRCASSGCARFSRC
jgi:hypothetical protein